MRMWMVPTQFLCRKHLLGEHVELHMFVGTINNGISVDGYMKKGLLDPDRIESRHTELADEMERRGYIHQSELPEIERPVKKIAEYKEIDTHENTLELMNRCDECRKRITDGLW